MNTDHSADSDDDQEPTELHSQQQGQRQSCDSGSQIVQKLACDKCRIRKVGCDRHDPCSRCVRMGVGCVYTTQPRVRHKRPRKPIAKQHDAKFEELSRKLDVVCRLLKDGNHPASIMMRSSLSNTPTWSSSSPRSGETESLDRGLLRTGVEDSEVEYEGSSSLSAHTTFASEFLKSIVGQDPPALCQVNRSSSIYEARPQPPGISGLRIPPTNVAFAVLRLLKEHPKLQLPWSMELESVDHFQEYVIKAYTSSQPSLVEQIILLSAFVSVLPLCLLTTAEPSIANDYESQLLLCRQSLDSAISRLPFRLPATFDSTLALVMASTYQLNRCRQTLAWNLICAATRMAQALGLHKACLRSCHDDVLARRKARLYVSIFLVEKMLSLRLGRASTLRDEELPSDLRMLLLGVNTAPFQIPFRELAFAHVQSLVYDRLYNPRGLQQSTAVKKTIAAELLCQVKDLMSEDCEVKDSVSAKVRSALGRDLAELFGRGDNISRLVLECLIYYSVSPTSDDRTFYDECIPLAREALSEHCECFALLSGQRKGILEIYLHWVLLTSPFVPFIILLCNVTETLDLADLKLLGSVIASIEDIHGIFPDITRQLALFKPLYEVAGSFIAAKTAEVPVIDDFGTYFQESTMDVHFGPALLSTLTHHTSSVPIDSHKEASIEGSILDMWGEVDLAFVNSPGFEWNT